MVGGRKEDRKGERRNRVGGDQAWDREQGKGLDIAFFPSRSGQLKTRNAVRLTSPATKTLQKGTGEVVRFQTQAPEWQKKQLITVKRDQPRRQRNSGTRADVMEG